MGTLNKLILTLVNLKLHILIFFLLRGIAVKLLTLNKIHKNNDLVGKNFFWILG